MDESESEAKLHLNESETKAKQHMDESESEAKQHMEGSDSEAKQHVDEPESDTIQHLHESESKEKHSKDLETEEKQPTEQAELQTENEDEELLVSPVTPSHHSLHHAPSPLHAPDASPTHEEPANTSSPRESPSPGDPQHAEAKNFDDDLALEDEIIEHASPVTCVTSPEPTRDEVSAEHQDKYSDDTHAFEKREDVDVEERLHTPVQTPSIGTASKAEETEPTADAASSTPLASK